MVSVNGGSSKFFMRNDKDVASTVFVSKNLGEFSRTSVVINHQVRKVTDFELTSSRANFQEVRAGVRVLLSKDVDSL